MLERLLPAKTAVFVVDIQEKLARAMPESRLTDVVRATNVLVETRRLHPDERGGRRPRLAPRLRGSRLQGRQQIDSLTIRATAKAPSSAKLASFFVGSTLTVVRRRFCAAFDEPTLKFWWRAWRSLA